MFQVLLNFIRKTRLPLLVKIILCTGVPFILAVSLIFAIHYKQAAESSLTWPFILKTMAYLLGTVLLFIGLVYAALFKLVQLPIRGMIAGIGKIGTEGESSLGTVDQNDELGELAKAIRQVGEKVRAKHKELSEQREIYWRLFEAAPCIITVQNKNFELIRYNQYFADHFPVRKGIHCHEAYKNQPWKCEPCPVEKTFEEGVPHFSEESGFYKDGSRAHWIVNASPMFDREGKVVAAVSVSLDITARKKLEEDLKKSERKYNAVFNNIPRALFLLNRETLTILDCNRSATSLYGYTTGEMIGKNFMEFFSETDREEHHPDIKTLQSIHRVRHMMKDGRSFYADILFTVSDYQAGLKVILAMVIDVTERIEAEQQVIQANKMATLGEMATGVAHELNQPLSVIQMISSFFVRKLDRGDLPDRETLSDVSSKLRSNVERASKIINHMREFGRKSTLEVGSVHINDVIQKSLDFFSQQLRLRNIEVTLDLEDGVPSIKADPNRLEQVFINLLTNARDAIEEKSLQHPLSEGEKRITIRTRSNRRYVFAEICDSGTGVPKELTDKIFEPFFTTKTVGKGTGLGLSISYRIISDYGGTIHAVSKEGHGACFDIRFPRATGA
jgi:PAS domain S-box-containing protein